MIKRVELLIVIILLTNCCIGQGDTNNFGKFILKFPQCTLPISSNDYFNNKHIYANNQCNISESEYNTYLYFNDNWKYLIYSEGKTSYYNYVIGCRFDLDYDKIGVLFFRAYFSDDPLEEKSELILSVYNKKGESISHIPVEGSYGDKLVFSSIIHNTNDLEINYKEYKSDGVEKYIKHFKIATSGEILPIQ